MAQRLELQGLFEEILGSRNVYFQPPPNLKMAYPAIRYERDFMLSDWADNVPYVQDDRYLVTVIDRDPDSTIPQAIRNLPRCVFDRFYATNDLNHNVFKLFF